MLALVDYDNVPRPDRQMGVDHVVRKLISLLPEKAVGGQRPRIRIYGGWYEADKLTKMAQQLVAEIRGATPVRIALSDSSTILADVELVYSSLSHPRTLVGNTYREQPLRGGLKCEGRPWIMCADNNGCPLGMVERFFNEEQCADSRCAVRPADLLRRREQKVVDTMMVADIAHAPDQGFDSLCVVSRDDDIWPGLGIAALKAKQLYHLSTAASARTPKYFRDLASPPYKFVLWS